MKKSRRERSKQRLNNGEDDEVAQIGREENVYEEEN